MNQLIKSHNWGYHLVNRQLPPKINSTWFWKSAARTEASSVESLIDVASASSTFVDKFVFVPLVSPIFGDGFVWKQGIPKSRLIIVPIEMALWRLYHIFAHMKIPLYPHKNRWLSHDFPVLPSYFPISNKMSESPHWFLYSSPLI